MVAMRRVYSVTQYKYVERRITAWNGILYYRSIIHKNMKMKTEKEEVYLCCYEYVSHTWVYCIIFVAAFRLPLLIPSGVRRVRFLLLLFCCRLYSDEMQFHQYHYHQHMNEWEIAWHRLSHLSFCHPYLLSPAKVMQTHTDTHTNTHILWIPY